MNKLKSEESNTRKVIKGSFDLIVVGVCLTAIILAGLGLFKLIVEVARWAW